MILDPPHGSRSPKAGLLKSPKRPLGKSSHVAALLTSPRPASPSVVDMFDKVIVAVAVAFVGVIKSVESSGTGPVGVPTEGSLNS